MVSINGGGKYMRVNYVRQNYACDQKKGFKLGLLINKGF